jgi:hypothetical protein
MFRKITMTILLYILLSLMYSCAVDGSIASATNITSYLVKSCGFLSVVIILLGTKKIFWRSVYNRLYYSYYTLAQITYILKKFKMPKNHKNAWKETNDNVRVIFGNKFQAVRDTSDYYIIPNEDNFIKNTNKTIKDDHKNTFYDQINDIRALCKNNSNIEEKEMNSISIYIDELIKKHDDFLDRLKNVDT